MFRWWLQCLSHFRLFIQQKANNLSQGLKACPHQTDFIAGCIGDKLYSLLIELIDHFTFTFRLEMCDAATQINIALVNELCFPKWMMALMVLVVVKFLTHQEHLRPRVKRSLTTPQEINLTNPERYHSLNVCQSGHFVCKKETAKRRSRGETGAISSMPPVAKGGNEGVSHEANCCCWHRRVFGHSGVIRSLKEKLHKFP